MCKSTQITVSLAVLVGKDNLHDIKVYEGYV
jgi:hypothetical protein